MSSPTQSLGEAMDRAVAALDLDRVRKAYWDQNEFVVLPGFLPRALVDGLLVPQVERLKLELNRNYIPRHKKGGSVSYFYSNLKDAFAYFGIKTILKGGLSGRKASGR